MKVVLDTNVLISALIKTGRPRDLLHKLAERKSLVLSKGILDEFVIVTRNAKIQKYVNDEDTAVFLSFLGSATKVVKVSSKFKCLDEDPDDDLILRTAYDAKATYIVSGDKHLLCLGKFRRIQIVTIEEMLRILEPKKPRKRNSFGNAPNSL
jgi:uncharacterized protein